MVLHLSESNSKPSVGGRLGPFVRSSFSGRPSRSEGGRPGSPQPEVSFAYEA